jgi:hypothetical protein
MNWFYTTRDQTQAGPVDEATLQSLFQSGDVTAESLVWRAGQDGWLPYSSVFPGAMAVPAAVAAASVAVTRCSECGQTFPPEQLIQLGGRPVCGACKPVAVQKLQEGVVGFGPAADPEQLLAMVRQRGFNFTIGSVIAQSWDLVKKNFWPSIGVTLLGYLVLMGSGQIPFLGLLATFFVQSQMMAGMNWYFLKQFRGESATINDSFAGFRRGYGQQAIYMLIFTGFMIAILAVCAVPMVLVMAFLSRTAEGTTPTTVYAVMALMIPAILVLWYLVMCWIFTPLLILDKGLSAWAAMKLSRRVVHMRFGKILGLFVVGTLLCLAGLLALIVGIIVVLPVMFAMLSRIYEDAFGEPAA